MISRAATKLAHASFSIFNDEVLAGGKQSDAVLSVLDAFALCFGALVRVSGVRTMLTEEKIVERFAYAYSVGARDYAEIDTDADSGNIGVAGVLPEEGVEQHTGL